MTKQSRLIFIFIFITHFAGAQDIVSYPWFGRDALSYDGYYKDVLKMALEQSKDKYGTYQIKEISAGVSQEHMIRLIKNKKVVNLFWTMTSIEREKTLLPIRVPLFRGLLGCRVFFN